MEIFISYNYEVLCITKKDTKIPSYSLLISAIKKKLVLHVEFWNRAKCITVSIFVLSRSPSQAGALID